MREIALAFAILYQNIAYLNWKRVVGVFMVKGISDLDILGVTAVESLNFAFHYFEICVWVHIFAFLPMCVCEYYGKNCHLLVNDEGNA